MLAPNPVAPAAPLDHSTLAHLAFDDEQKQYHWEPQLDARRRVHIEKLTVLSTGPSWGDYSGRIVRELDDSLAEIVDRKVRELQGEA